MKKRRRARPPAARVEDSLYPTLDLHGATAGEAVRIARRWIDAQLASGERVVRLITGWGRHSAGPPVVRGEIEMLLASLRGVAVDKFSLETGGGVFRVTLRPARSGGQVAPIPRKQRRPALRDDERRRALESLDELGVTPTPELIEAEALRLRGEAGER